MKLFFTERSSSIAILGSLIAAMAVLACPCTNCATAAASAAAAQDDRPDDARRAMEEARQHEEAGRWRQAADAYSRALTLMPDNREAQEGLQRAMAMLDRAGSIQQVEEERERQRQRAIVEFDDAYQRSTEALNRGDFAAAEQAILTAKIRLERSREVLREAEFTQRLERADRLIADIEEARIVQRLVEEEQRREEARRQQREQEVRARQERERMINENLVRVRQLQQELKYAEALQVIDEILFIDEQNPAALALRDVIRSSELYREYAETQRRKDWSYGRLQMDNQRAMIAPRRNIDGPGMRSLSGLMEYPEDWPQLSMRRSHEGGFRDSPADRAIAMRLQEATIPVDFTNNTFDQIVNFISQVTGEPIYVDWRALSLIGVDRDDEITLQLAELPVANALERILEQFGDDLDQPGVRHSGWHAGHLHL
jgi:tetratricopeptide (TPR) repeat protein